MHIILYTAGMPRFSTCLWKQNTLAVEARAEGTEQEGIHGLFSVSVSDDTSEGVRGMVPLGGGGRSTRLGGFGLGLGWMLA